MKVRAKENGFYDGVRRREGDVFEFKGKKPGSWMEQVEEDAKPARRGPQVQEPVALSEITRDKK